MRSSRSDTYDFRRHAMQGCRDTKYSASRYKPIPPHLAAFVIPTLFCAANNIPSSQSLCARQRGPGRCLTLLGLQSRFGDNWRQITRNVSGLSPKRDWSSKRGDKCLVLRGCFQFSTCRTSYVRGILRRGTVVPEQGLSSKQNRVKKEHTMLQHAI